GEQSDFFQVFRRDTRSEGLLDQPVAKDRGIADAEATQRRPEQFSLAEIASRLRCLGRHQVELLINRGGPVDGVEEWFFDMLLDDVGLVVQGDASPAGELVEGFEETDVLAFLNKLDDVAVLTTGPTAITLAAGIDVEGGAVVIVKRTESFI